MPAKCPSFLELAHLVISLLCGNKPVSYSYKLVYQSTLLVGTMGVIAGWGISLLMTAIEKSIKY